MSVADAWKAFRERIILHTFFTINYEYYFNLIVRIVDH
jgi:hypothetical protein